MDDLAAVLAQVIQQSKDKGGGRSAQPRTVMHSMGNQLTGTNRTSMNVASVNVDPLLRMMGYMTDEEKAKAVDRLKASLDSTDNATRDKILKMEGTQKFLEKAATAGWQSGQYGIYRGDDGMWTMGQKKPAYEMADTRASAPMLSLIHI